MSTKAVEVEKFLRHRFVQLFFLTLAACGPGVEPEPREPAMKPGRHTHPDFPKLWREMELVPGGIDERGEGNPIEQLASDGSVSAYRALWAAVGKAEEAGLYALYGFERANTNEPSYEALFCVRTSGGEYTCLYANGDLHDERPDQTTVPARRVPLPSFGLLERLAAFHVPFEHPASMTSRMEDGSWYLFHVFVRGESHSALWYEPLEEVARTREDIADYAKRRPVLALRSALWAAAPPELFPRDESPDGDIPDDEFWQYDAAEVYRRTPGYTPRSTR